VEKNSSGVESSMRQYFSTFFSLGYPLFWAHPHLEPKSHGTSSPKSQVLQPANAPKKVITVIESGFVCVAVNS
jgi:hypothetical protein